ncbi:MAG: hypothetical protein Q9227_007194 [Pyrenula ochraceoflavens]
MSADPDGDSPAPAGKRERAPTINIDTSAVNGQTEPTSSTIIDRPSPLPRIQTQDLDRPPSSVTPSPTDLRKAASFESRESRPTSPHNVSSPTNKWDGNGQNYLSVPQARSRGNSMDSEGDGNPPSSYGGETIAANSASEAPTQRPQTNNGNLIDDKDALKPDPGTEADFEVENNKFAFSPGQLNKLINPKSLSAFHALGGLAGLEKGLRTNRDTGLSVDEVNLDGLVSFEDAVQSAVSDYGDMKPMRRSPTTGTMGSSKEGRDDAFGDRKRIFKDNRLPERKSKSLLQLAWMAYNDKVLILLTVAAVISLALGIYQAITSTDGEARVQWVEGVAIIVAIVIVVVVGALNDYQKERQFLKLNKKKDERFVKVIRSGKSREISVYDILVGDVMHLEPGDLIPVDGILIEGHNIKCDESSATGESDILRKTGGDEVYQAIDHHESIHKMDPFILSGGKVSEGVGTFLVTSVGVNSSYGKTLMSLQDEQQTTPLQSKLNVLAEYIAKLGLASGLLLFVVLFIKFLAQLKHMDGGAQTKGQNFLQIFIVAVTIIVVAVPEGLPLAVTLALAFATTRMLRDNNLVRLLRACETMGNATTVCSDKTGTLTQNKMSVVAGTVGTYSRFGDKQIPGESAAAPEMKQRESIDSPNDVSSTEFVSTLSPEITTLIKDSITLNSTAFESEENGDVVFVGSKTETALLTFAREHLGIASVSEERANAEVAQLIPFDSGRKCMAVVIKLSDGRYRMLVKGASEILIAQCTRIVRDPTKDASEVPMSRENVETLGQIVNNYASRSLRTIALLYRDFQQWPPRGAPVLEEDHRQAQFEPIFKDMTFLGVVGIQDPLRPGVADAVRDCQVAGVFVRMVTGDNLTTAKAIATECGIFTPGGVAMEGPRFRKLSSRQMTQLVPRLQVLARSSPEDKRILVAHLKKLGETVAVTGDGTNDAPALKIADVGFSMGIAGTEVAKEASAIILMDDNFASIVKAISWGRTVNDAVKKFLQFQITVNITAVLLTFVSAVSSGSEESVLTAVQLLWVNLIMDTLAALALATDPPSPSLLRRKPEPKSAPLINLTMWKMIIGQSIFQLVVTFILYFAGASIFSYQSDREKQQLQTTVFNTFVWMQIFNQYNCRRLDNGFNIFEGILRNKWFIGIQTIIVAGQVLIVFIGGQAFHVHRLNGAQWAYSLILGLLSIPIAVIIRCIPDELIRKIMPKIPKRKDDSPQLFISDEDQMQQWRPELEEIRQELTFLKKIRGGRMANLAYKIQHPRETWIPRSRSGSHSRSNASLPRTPSGEGSAIEPPNTSPQSSDPAKRKRGRSRSNSAFGPAAAMAGVVAGSIAGGWSPIERGHDEADSIPFSRSRAHSGLDDQPGIEIHPGTRKDDPIVAENPLTSKIPPSQNPELAPHFEHTPPDAYPPSRVIVEEHADIRSRRWKIFLGISSLVVFVYSGIWAIDKVPPVIGLHLMGSLREIPTDEESLNLYEAPDDFCREVDDYIHNHPFAAQLRANPNFTESRPHLKIPKPVRGHNLTAGTLSGPGKIVVPPYIWSEKDGKSLVSMFYLGDDICGHPDIIHGGLLATMLDEGLARCCFPALPNKVGVTASLNMTYIRPTIANQYLVLRAKTVNLEGRKAWVEGHIETLPEEGMQPEILVKASALFIEPRGAQAMKSLYRVA